MLCASAASEAGSVLCLSTSELKGAIQPFCAGKKPSEPVVGVQDGAVYTLVKKYGKLAGSPELHPHDLRHHFCERLQEAGVPIRVTQELAGHESIETTQVYVGVTAKHLEDAIRKMEAVQKKPAIPTNVIVDKRTGEPKPRSGPGSPMSWEITEFCREHGIKEEDYGK